MSLNARQQLFVESYLFHENATQAAKDAGYSEKTAYSQGHDLLKHPEIAKAIAEGREKKMTAAGLTQDLLLREIMALAFSDIGQAFNEDGTMKKLHDMPKEIRKAVSSFEIIESHDKDGNLVKTQHRLKLWDKNKAHEQLGRYLKMFTDKLEVDDKSGIAEKLRKFREKK